MGPKPLDVRLGLAFLGLSFVLLLGLAAGAAGVAIYLSWLAALAGILIVLRASPRKLPAALALGVLVLFILAGLLGSSLTLGAKGGVLARLGWDVLPSEVMDLAIIAGPLAGGVLLGAGGIPGAGGLARVGTLLGLGGILCYVAVNADGDGWFTLGGIPISGGVFMFPAVAGAALVGIAFARAAWTAFGARDAGAA